MNRPIIENIVVDEPTQRTYVVLAHRILTDGELYSAIRLRLLRSREPFGKGARVVINVSHLP